MTASDISNPGVIAMIGRCKRALDGPRVAAFACAVVLFAHQASAQTNIQPPQAQPQQAQPPAPGATPQTPPKKDGFFDALGRWWDQSAADFDANLKKMKTQIDETNERNVKAARDAARDAVTATKEATDALMKLPTTRIIEGRERCTIAPNGSPDCAAAAETICKVKGFKTGSSANIESARKCSARALLTRNEDACVNETIVTRAACQ